MLLIKILNSLLLYTHDVCEFDPWGIFFSLFREKKVAVVYLTGIEMNVNKSPIFFLIGK